MQGFKCKLILINIPNIISDFKVPDTQCILHYLPDIVDISNIVDYQFQYHISSAF